MYIKRSGVKIANVVSKTFSINNEPIDITDDDDDGFRTLMEESGVRSIDVSCEGVLKADTLLGVAAAADPTLITADELDFHLGGKITGSFRFNSLEISGETAGRIQFSGSFQSTGAWVFTA